MNDDASLNRAALATHLERWFEHTQNPLYVWEAIARCYDPDNPTAPLPEFCRAYLKTTALNVTNLAWGKDFRDTQVKINPADSLALLAEALGVSRARTKNAFARVQDDKQAMSAALSGGKARIKRERSVDDDRAARILRHGKKLAGR